MVKMVKQIVLLHSWRSMVEQITTCTVWSRAVGCAMKEAVTLWRAQAGTDLLAELVTDAGAICP